jgi:hypothetical protein
MNPRVSAVKYQSPYKLILTFTNKEVKEFSISNYLHYPVYDMLKDERNCRKVKVFNGTVVWDDFTDFDPDTLYLESKPMVITI